MVVGFFASQQALSFAERLDPGSAASLVLIALVPVAYLVVSRRALNRKPKNSSSTLLKEDDR